MTDLFERFVVAVIDGVLGDRYAGTDVQELADRVAELARRGTTTRSELAAAAARLFLAVEREAHALEKLLAEDAAKKAKEAVREAKKPLYQPRRYRPCKVLPLIYRGDPNQAVLGDPPPGRSALDQRNQRKETSHV